MLIDKKDMFMKKMLRNMGKRSPQELLTAMVQYPPPVAKAVWQAVTSK